MKIIPPLLLFVMLAASAFAADTPAAALMTVAVYGFTDADKNSDSYGSKVTTLVTADLTAETNLVMLERSELQKALGEQSIGASGMVSSDTAAKIGQITGAKVLVSGQVIKIGQDHLVAVANIIGTETGRLFAVQAEGTTENLVDLTVGLSRKIAQKILDQSANFVVASKSHEEYLDRIVKSITGTNRPTVSVSFHSPKGPMHASSTGNAEMGVILQKAGFTIVDGNSERKPDITITGVVDVDDGPRRGQLYSSLALVDTKVQERVTGKILVVDFQTARAMDVGRATSRNLAVANAIDGVAERIVPLLAK